MNRFHMELDTTLRAMMVAIALSVLIGGFGYLLLNDNAAFQNFHRTTALVVEKPDQLVDPVHHVVVKLDNTGERYLVRIDDDVYDTLAVGSRVKVIYFYRLLSGTFSAELTP